MDAGLSGAALSRRLAARGCDPQEINGILITHEHNDHIQGAGAFARRHEIPVYLTAGTRAAAGKKLGTLPRLHLFQAGREFEIGEIGVRPFTVPHDAADPVAFTLFHGTLKAGIATDMGTVTALTAQHLAACRLLVLEFNHDLEMLKNGPYPPHIKQRIRERHGHLSNEQAGELLERVLRAGGRLEGLALAHISEINNRPELARGAARRILERFRLHERVEMHVAGPDEVVSLALRC